MSYRAPPPPAGASRSDRIRSSSDLGATLRSVLVAPERGYRGALRMTARRERAGRRPAEGIAPSVLAAIGGAGAMLLWLKLGGALGWRRVAPSDYSWTYLAAALVIGGLLGLLAQAVWALAGPYLTRALGGQTRASDLRLVWGGSSLPQVFAVILLLPLDLSIAGPATFTSARFADPVAAAWASLSVALAVALALWSLYLFFRGTQVATGLSWARVGLMGLLAALCLTAVVTVSALAALQAGGS